MGWSVSKKILLTILCLILAIAIVLLAIRYIPDTETSTIVLVVVIAASVLALLWIWLKGRSKTSQEEVSSDNTTNDDQVVTMPEHHEDTPVSVQVAEVSRPLVQSPIQEATMDKLLTTGSPCPAAGTYFCSEHAGRSVNMREGKKFPPCRGDGKGHYATWMRSKPLLVAHTGAISTATGRYVCNDHPARVIVIQAGKKFPPCRGDEKAHSAEWMLTEQNP